MTWKTRGRPAFDALRRARTVRSGPLIVSCLPGLPGQPPQLAYAIGKRVGNAVVRNRLRRRLRELARRPPGLPSGTYLIRAKPHAGSLGFWDLAVHFDRVAQMVRQWPALQGPAAQEQGCP